MDRVTTESVELASANDAFSDEDIARNHVAFTINELLSGEANKSVLRFLARIGATILRLQAERDEARRVARTLAQALATEASVGKIKIVGDENDSLLKAFRYPR